MVNVRVRLCAPRACWPDQAIVLEAEAIAEETGASVEVTEDIGLADPMALVVATAAAHAVEYVGMPEARLNLAEATLYLATAPKSNTVLSIMQAL